MNFLKALFCIIFVAIFFLVPSYICATGLALLFSLLFNTDIPSFSIIYFLSLIIDILHIIYFLCSEYKEINKHIPTYSVTKESHTFNKSIYETFDYHKTCFFCGKTLDYKETHSDYRFCEACQEKLINVSGNRKNKTIDKISGTAIDLQNQIYIQSDIENIISKNHRKIHTYHNIINNNDAYISKLSKSFKKIFKSSKENCAKLLAVNKQCQLNISILRSEILFCQALLNYNIPVLQHNKILQQKEKEDMEHKIAVARVKDAKKAKELAEQQKRNEAVSNTIQNQLYQRERYVILKNNYSRGNAVDNYTYSSLKDMIMQVFGNKCIKCGSTEDLTLDHLWLSKNEGGNFIMKEIETHNLINNTIVLCRKCNSSKSDQAYTIFFNNAQLYNITQLSILLSHFYNEDSSTRSKCNMAYANYYSRLRKQSKSETDAASTIINIDQAHQTLEEFKKTRNNKESSSKSQPIF